jgi:hypothetical protein
MTGAPLPWERKRNQASNFHRRGSHSPPQDRRLASPTGPRIRMPEISQANVGDSWYIATVAVEGCRTHDAGLAIFSELELHYGSNGVLTPRNGR